MSLQGWVQIGRELGASDLHLEADSPLAARVRGELRSICTRICGGSSSPLRGWW